MCELVGHTEVIKRMVMEGRLKLGKQKERASGPSAPKGEKGRVYPDSEGPVAPHVSSGSLATRYVPPCQEKKTIPVRIEAKQLGTDRERRKQKKKQLEVVNFPVGRFGAN